MISKNPLPIKEDLVEKGKDELLIEDEFDQKIQGRNKSNGEFKGACFKCGNVGHRDF